jgi:hypothetical protein
MKFVIRCTLATVAVFTCFLLIRNNPGVDAQSWGDSCSTEENTCLANGGGSSCTSQYNNCITERKAACAADSEQGCTVSYNDSGHSCTSSCSCFGGCTQPPPACPQPQCDQLGSGNSCSFVWVCDSPIIIDVEGKGFHLTNEANGVLFKFFGDQKKQVAWTDPKYGNAWLALDRNGNGIIDDATELFGNFTPQPQSPSANGFLALAVYDSPENGGNGDSYITESDSIYPHLLLWTDTNHNGISEPNELRTLAQAGITSISLNYRDGHRRDQYGNLFRYRSHVKMESVSDFDHLIYDVYLMGAN